MFFIYLSDFLGYLPDPNGEKYVTAPRQVSALHHKDITLSLVAASDGATVCVTTRGDIYLLADYQCKKMASKYVMCIFVKKYNFNNNNSSSKT